MRPRFIAAPLAFAAFIALGASIALTAPGCDSDSTTITPPPADAAIDTSITDACGESCAPIDATPTCANPGETFCGTACTNTKTDPKNCGKCGDICVNNTCNSGACEKAIFVTSELFPTTLASTGDPLAAADAHCQSAATAQKLSGTFMAWLGTKTAAPSTRFTKSKLAYVLVDGTTVVATDYTSLTSGTLTHAIDHDETGATLVMTDDTRRVMTNVAIDGSPGNPTLDCDEWTVAQGPLSAGDPTTTNSEWTHMTTLPSNWDCTISYRLYCVEQ